MTGQQKFIGWILTLIIVVLGFIFGWWERLIYLTNWYYGAAIVIVTTALVLVTLHYAKSTTSIAEATRKQGETLAQQLSLEREPIISLSSLDESPEGYYYDFILRLQNSSARHARVEIVANLRLGEGPGKASFPSKHYTGEWAWLVPANTSIRVQVPAHEVTDHLIGARKQLWDSTPPTSQKNRERESVLAIEIQATYAPYYPHRLPSHNDVRQLPPQRWYFDFDINKWIAEVTPPNWKTDGISLRQLRDS